MLFVYWFLWPIRLVWLLVCCLYKEVYLQIFKCVSFWLHGCCGKWEGGRVNQVNHTSWVAVVTPTDRPNSVRNCCLIELFCGVVCVVTLSFWHFCWRRGFCHRTGSDLLLFVSTQIYLKRTSKMGFLFLWIIHLLPTFHRLVLNYYLIYIPSCLFWSFNINERSLRYYRMSLPNKQTWIRNKETGIKGNKARWLPN